MDWQLLKYVQLGLFYKAARGDYSANVYIMPLGMYVCFLKFHVPHDMACMQLAIYNMVHAYTACKYSVYL